MTKTKLIFLILNFIVVNLFSQNSEYKYARVPEKYLNRLNATTTLSVNGLNKGFEVQNILPKEYKTDGSVDYTVYIQSAIDKYDTLIFPDFPLKINSEGLNVRSDNTLIFKEHSTLIMTPNGNPNYSVINLDRVNNVKIYNVTIIGDREEHLNELGQWGMGISIRGSKNVLIENAAISKCWGDGIYLGSVKDGRTNEDIQIINSHFDHNRRNGISIISGVNINIQNCIISNTVGHNPMAGIDIEPNTDNDIINNIQLTDIVTFNNRWYGIIVSLSKLVSKKKTHVQISIDNHRDDNSTIAFATSLGARKKSDLSPIKGTINVNNPVWVDSRKTSFFYYDTFHNDMKVKFKNVKIIGDIFKSNQSERRAEFNKTVKAKSDLQISF